MIPSERRGHDAPVAERRIERPVRPVPGQTEVALAVAPPVGETSDDDPGLRIDVTDSPTALRPRGVVTLPSPSKEGSRVPFGL